MEPRPQIVWNQRSSIDDEYICIQEDKTPTYRGSWYNDMQQDVLDTLKIVN